MPESGPKVSVEQTAAGDYAIGVTIDKVFVPFVTKDGGYVETRVAQAKEQTTASSSSSSEEE